MAILQNLQGPADLRGLSEAQLAELADEIRETIIRPSRRPAGISGRRSAWSS